MLGHMCVLCPWWCVCVILEAVCCNKVEGRAQGVDAVALWRCQNKVCMRPVDYLGEKISLRPELVAVLSPLDDKGMARFLQLSEGICYFLELRGFLCCKNTFLRGKKKWDSTLPLHLNIGILTKISSYRHEFILSCCFTLAYYQTEHFIWMWTVGIFHFRKSCLFLLLYLSGLPWENAKGSALFA